MSGRSRRQPPAPPKPTLDDVADLIRLGLEERGMDETRVGEMLDVVRSSALVDVRDQIIGRIENVAKLLCPVCGPPIIAGLHPDAAPAPLRPAAPNGADHAAHAVDGG